MRFVRGLATIMVVLLVVLAILFVDFVYKTFSVSPRDVKADAVVVLAGGRGRVDEGVKLYREGRGRLLFLIGVDPAVRKSELFRELPGERRGEGVYLEKVSVNTLENAIYARDLLARHNVRSILLITSQYHMKRATLIFKNVLPRDVAIYPHPITSSNLREEWWNHGGSFRLLFSEFYKYCMFRFFFLFASGELRSVPLHLPQ